MAELKKQTPFRVNPKITQKSTKNPGRQETKPIQPGNRLIFYLDRTGCADILAAMRTGGN